MLAAVSAMTIGSSVGQANTAKRGFAGSNDQMITGLNASWYYTWWTDPNPAVTTAEFVPIMQNQWAVGAATQYNNNPNVKAVLGFNEPERTDQANLTVNAALDLWAQTQASNKELVSPAPSDTSDGRAWLQSFMSGATSRGYRVDAVAFHWYGDTRGGASSAANFLGAVDWYHNTFHKNVWITEFGGIDWSGTNPISQATNRAFLEAASAGLESRSYVERYSWYQWDSACRLMNDDGTLTTIGEFYTGNTIINSGVAMDLSQARNSANVITGNTGNDVWYLRNGGTLTDVGTGAGHFMRRILATGSSTLSGTNGFAIQDYYLRLDPGAVVTKAGVNTVDFQNLKLDNNGTLNINNGAIRLRGGMTTAGTGGIVNVNAGGSLVFSSTSAATQNVVGLTVNLQGGTLRADDFKHTLAGSLNIASDSTVDGLGEMNISATLTGSGRITKIGGGTLRLSNFFGSPARSGPIDVNVGTLMIEGSNATNSVAGTGVITLGVASKLAGRGLISGNTSIAGELSPGLSDSSPGTFKFNGNLSLGANAFTSIDLNTSGVDSINSAGAATTTTVHGTLVLRPTATYSPTILTSFNLVSTVNGLTGRFDRVTGLTLDSSRSIAISYTDKAVVATIARTGDANLDGTVDFNDLLALAQHYNTSTGNSWAMGDFTGEGTVNFTDMLQLARQYGISDVPAGFSAELAADTSASFASEFKLAQSLVPEPTTLGLLAAALPMLRRRRRA